MFQTLQLWKILQRLPPEGPSVRSVRGAGRDILGQATITNPSLIHFHPHHPFLLMKSVLWGNCLIFLTQKKHLLKLWSYYLIHYLFSQQLRQRVGFPRGFSQRLKLSFSFPAWVEFSFWFLCLNFPFGFYAWVEFSFWILCFSWIFLLDLCLGWIWSTEQTTALARGWSGRSPLFVATSLHTMQLYFVFLVYLHLSF